MYNRTWFEIDFIYPSEIYTTEIIFGIIIILKCFWSLLCSPRLFLGLGLGKYCEMLLQLKKNVF